MIRLEDCIALSGLTEAQVLAIANEDLPENCRHRPRSIFPSR